MAAIPPNELICSICFEIMHEPTMGQCKHTFCNDCITKWIKVNPICPLDRGPILSLKTNKRLKSKIVVYFKKNPEQERKHAEEKSVRKTSDFIHVFLRFCTPFSPHIVSIKFSHLL